MKFSKSFILIASMLLVLVGAAFGYSAKVLRQVGDIDRELKLIVGDIEYLKYRLLILEIQQIRMEPPGKSNIWSRGLGSAGRKGQPLPLGKLLGRE